jgi:triosephosphate isomerase
MYKPLIVGNWKMHGSLDSINTFFEEFKAPNNAQVVIMPPAIYLRDCISHKKGFWELGIQNVWTEYSGAYTGEISASMVGDFGVSWVLVGHSERRNYQNETDELIRQKVKCSIEVGMNVILCVGETMQERSSGAAQEVIANQLEIALNQGLSKEVSRIVVAYEPVWAIGTGNSATEIEAQEMHSFIRQTVVSVLGETAADLRILYGGSVKPDNAGLLLAQTDVDGLLVGGASLQADSFSDIIKARV